MKNALVPMVFGVALLAAQSADAVYVTIEPSSQHYRNQPVSRNKPVSLGGNVVGITGDYFVLGTGTHRLYIDAPRDHLVIMDVEVRQDDLEIEIDKVQSSHANGDMYEWNTAWTGRLETTRTQFRQGILWTIVLPEIRFIGRTGNLALRPPAASIGCERRAYNLNVDTQPRNAEIWINHERFGYRTPTGQLRVSYCEYQDSVHILTRTDDHVNCEQTFALHPDAEIVFRCELEPI